MPEAGYKYNGGLSRGHNFEFVGSTSVATVQQRVFVVCSLNNSILSGRVLSVLKALTESAHSVSWAPNRIIRIAGKNKEIYSKSIEAGGINRSRRPELTFGA